VAADVVDGAFLGGAHPVLDLGEGLLDRIEIGRVRRQIPEPGAGGLDDAAQRDRLVAAEIVHDNDVVRLQRRQQDLLDIGAEALSVDWPVEQAGSGKAVMAQCTEEGHRAPVTVGCKAAKAVSFWRPSTQWRHVGLDPGLVDEDQTLRIKTGLPRSPAPPPPGYIRAALLKSEQRFF